MQHAMPKHDTKIQNYRTKATLKCHNFASSYHYVRLTYEKEKDVFLLLLCHNFCLFKKNHNFAQSNYN